MTAIEGLRARIPEAARDVRLNLTSVLSGGALSQEQRYGVALASAIRLAAFSVFLFWASFRKGGLAFPGFWKAGPGRAVASLGIFAAGLSLNALAGLSFWGAAVLSFAFIAVVWRRLLDPAEREFLLARVRFRRAAGRDDAVKTEVPL